MKKHIRLIIIVGVAALVLGGAAAAYLLLRRPAPNGPLVVIDAGHGGSYIGNQAPDGLKESDANLAIAKRLRAKLNAHNYRVIMTRTTDADVADKTVPSWRHVAADGTWVFGIDKTSPARDAALDSELQARVDVANRADADLFVSIHNNSSEDTSVRGTETYAYEGDAPGKALAASVQDAVIAKTGNADRGTHASSLYVCHWTNMPAVLVEAAYYTNAQDAKALRTREFQDRVADGIVDGIDRWFASHPLRETEPQVAADDSAALACALSSAAYPDGAKAAVVLAAGNDALGPSASVLAQELDAPLLFASASSISASTAIELRRLNPDRVVVVGASDAVDPRAASVAVADAISNRTNVDILAEKTTPAAAAALATQIEVPTGEVVIADAADPAAVAALAPYAARHRAPVLLSEDGRLGDEATAFLSENRARVTRILAVGCAKKPARPSGWPVTAVSDADADALAARVLAIDSPPGTVKRRPVVVDAAQAADVFTAAMEAARRKQPLVQLHAGVLVPYSREFLVNRSKDIEGFLILRDAGSIGPGSESALHKSIGR